MTGPIRLVVADDHPVFLGGLQTILDDAGFEVAAAVSDGEAAIDAVSAYQPDVVLMDLRMPEMSGAEAIRQLRQIAPAVSVLVLTTYDTDDDVLPAIEAGAIGYLLKDAPREELVRAVRAAFQGDAVLSPSVARRLMGQVRKPALDALSERELEVLRLIAGGASNRDAAAQLFISESTVKTHLLHIYEKLGVRDRAAAVGEAYKRRLLS